MLTYSEKLVQKINSWVLCKILIYPWNLSKQEWVPEHSKTLIKFGSGNIYSPLPINEQAFKSDLSCHLVVKCPYMRVVYTQLPILWEYKLAALFLYYSMYTCTVQEDYLRNSLELLSTCVYVSFSPWAELLLSCSTTWTMPVKNCHSHVT